MADEKQYSESEHIAILSDRVKTETAALTAERDQLKTELDNGRDIAESAKVALEAERDAAKKELADYKAEIETEREAAGRQEERLKKVRESAKHLGEDFFKDEARVTRIAAMADEDFDVYVADLEATAPGAPVATATGAPRETAMDGKPADLETKSAAGSFLLRRYITQEG